MSFLVRTPHRYLHQRGAVMITMAVLVLALFLCTALGMEISRMLTSRMQMGSISEYVAEKVLADLVISGTKTGTATINQIVNQNHVMGLSAGTFASCYTLNCGSSVEVARGCFTPAGSGFGSFRANDPPSCGAGESLAVTVRIKTGGGRVFAKILAGLFSAAAINISTRVISYRHERAPGEIYFMTGPYWGTSS